MMQGKGILEPEEMEPAGDPTTPDDTPQHEGAESPELEAQEGGEEDGAEGADPNTDPGYGKALDLVMSKLYDENIADGIAQAINQSQDKTKAIVEQAGMLLSVADDATQGSVPDELYISFAIDMLGEVIEIAQASGVKLAGSDMAVVVREFITDTVEGLGGDLTQVKQAMAQVSPDELGSAMEQAGG